MREIKSIVGLRVISVEEGANVGIVSQVVVDLAWGTVVGLIVGEGPGERGVLAAEIKTMGADAIMVSSRAVARVLSEVPELESRQQAATAQLTAFTASGKRLGLVSSIFIDPYDLVVTRYEVSSGPLKDLADGVLVLPILPGTTHGQDAVILPDEQVQQLGREAGGWRVRFEQWGEGARKQVHQVSEQAEKLYESGSETVKKEAKVVREKASKLSESAEKLYESGSEVVKKEAGVVRQKASDLTTKTREAVTKLGEREDAAPVEPEAAAAPADEPPADIVPVPEEHPGDETAAPGEADDAVQPTEQ